MKERKIIPVVFCIDKNYAKYLAVTLKSLVSNTSQCFTYQINIIAEELPTTMLNFLEIIANENLNIQINLVDVDKVLDPHIKDMLWVSNHLTKATYYRMLIPRLFKNFSKVLYLDADTIILADVAELYNHDIGNASIGAIRDVACILGHQLTKHETEYNNNILKITNMENYFNAGIMLFNIEKLLKENFENAFIKKLRELKQPRWSDQDVFNPLFNNDVKLIDASWNITWLIKFFSDAIYLLPDEIKNEYWKGYKNPKIIHYISQIKPWNSPHLEHADKWWHYARQTPFYEEILFENIEKKCAEKINNLKHEQHHKEIEQLKTQINFLQHSLSLPRYTAHDLAKMKKKYYKYKLLSKILFGKMRQKYKNKRKMLKEQIRNIKNNIAK